MQKYGELPSNPGETIDDKLKDLVMHAQIQLTENGSLMGGDAVWDYEKGDSVSISVEHALEEKIKKAWNVLSKEGTILMNLVSTPYAGLHGSLKDKYGFRWIFTVADY